jgi:hypothetical protein
VFFDVACLDTRSLSVCQAHSTHQAGWLQASY